MSTTDFIARLFGIPIIRDPKEAERLGYQLPGTDPRIGGDIGEFLGGIQKRLSFKTDEVPTRTIEHIGSITLATDTWSNGRVHYSIAVPRGDKWFTLRLGWRYDPNYPGAIFDIVPKFNSTKPFIAEATERQQNLWGK